MTLRILPNFLILIVVLFHCTIPGRGETPPCNGILSDVFAVSDDLSFVTTVPANSSQVLSQQEIDVLANGFMVVYNQLQGDTCNNQTILVSDVDGTQVVRVRRNLATTVTRVISFRITGNCRACGNKSLFGNDAPGRLLQQDDKTNEKSNSGSSTKINKARFLKNYSTWITNQRASGKYKIRDIKSSTIEREGRCEIVGS